jgi:hypothetical protein
MEISTSAGSSLRKTRRGAQTFAQRPRENSMTGWVQSTEERPSGQVRIVN